MRLGDGGSSDGCVVKCSEERGRRRAELGGEQRLDGVGRGGWQAVLQAGELGDGLWREEIGAGGEELAKLDEGASGLGERATHACPETSGATTGRRLDEC